MESSTGLRYHDRSCENCRYFRIHETAAVVSECLMHGRTLGVANKDNHYLLTGWARERVCDLWSRRPKSWIIYSEGTERNPHWVDPYLPREVNQRRRKRLKLLPLWQ